MSRDTPSVFLPAVLFGLSLTVDVLHAVLHFNRLRYWSVDTFWIALAALLLLGLPAAIGIALLGRWLGRRVQNGAAAALGVAGAGVVVYGLAEAIFESSETGAFFRSHVGLGSFILLALGALWRLPRPRVALLGAFVVGVALTAAGGGRNVSYASLAGQIERLRLTPVPFRGRLLLLGVDGLGWDTLTRWAATHPNENVLWFRQRALEAPLHTLVPTLSPRIWSSIATGVPPDEHGVVAFTSLDYAGLYHSRLLSPRFEGAFYWSRLLEGLGAARRVPVSSLDLRKPPIWQILSRPGYPVDVLGWWATWPAQPLAGRMVSDRFYFSRGEPEMGFHEPEVAAPAVPGQPDRATPADGLTFPPALEQRLASLRRAPEDMTAAELARFLNATIDEDRESDPAANLEGEDPRTEIRYAYTNDETWFRIAMKFLDDAPLNSTMVAYFRGVDMVSHGAMRFSHLYSETDEASRETHDLYSEVICHYYDYVLSRLRELIEKAGENTVVIIVSDHGFEYSGHGMFGHYHAPDGVFLALGGGKTGIDTAQKYHVYDVAPTLLWLRGFPAGEDMPGRADGDLFPNFPGGERHTLATYGYRVVAPGASRDDARADEEMMRLLRTLGYVK
jgi:Type I phosphodiesterase / nucleotide pyrophosphatase